MPSASHRRGALTRNRNVLIAGSTAKHRLNDPFIEIHASQHCLSHRLREGPVGVATGQLSPRAVTELPTRPAVGKRSTSPSRPAPSDLGVRLRRRGRDADEPPLGIPGIGIASDDSLAVVGTHDGVRHTVPGGRRLKTCACVENNPRLRCVVDHVQGVADGAAESIQRMNHDRVAIAGKPQHPLPPWAVEGGAGILVGIDVHGLDACCKERIDLPLVVLHRSGQTRACPGSIAGPTRRLIL